MAPELVRFYGGSPMDWLRLPFGLARKFHEAIPAVRRQESPLVPASAPEFMGAPRPVRKPKSIDEMRSRLSGMGISVAEAARG